jgi:adenylate cyclase
LKRKIAAIIAADVAGYSTLVATDEEATISRLEAARHVFDELVGRYGGRIFNTAGDAVLAEFASAVEAVRCALEIQESLRTKNWGVPEESQLRFRLGINLGDVIERDGDLLGDGVNIAARLEGLAEPGGICVSRAVYEQVENKLSIGFASIGPQTVKNIPNPIHVYRVSGAKELPQPKWRKAIPAVKMPVAIAATATVTALVAGLVAYAFNRSAQSVAVSNVENTPHKTTEAPRAVDAREVAPTVEAKVEAPKPADAAERAQRAVAPAATVEERPPAKAAIADMAAAHEDTAMAQSVDETTSKPAPAAPAPKANATAIVYDIALWCEKLAWTPGPLHQSDVALTLRTSTLTYDRPIHWPTVSSPIIGYETGAGTVDAKGKAVLEAGWSSDRRRFTARYEGTLGGDSGTLKGVQKWVSDGKAYNRPCVLKLTRRR